jgi:Flp pilus assembly protein TadG
MPGDTDLKAPQGTDSSARRRRPRLGSERGQAILEIAITLPLILLVCVSIFEFGRVYQTVQVLSNAAREGARVAILPEATPADVTARVNQYLHAGQLGNATNATVAVNQNIQISIGATNASASKVTVNYPFSFMVLNPVARLIVHSSNVGAPITLAATAEMRNEAQ